MKKSKIERLRDKKYELYLYYDRKGYGRFRRNKRRYGGAYCWEDVEYVSWSERAWKNLLKCWKTYKLNNRKNSE